MNKKRWTDEQKLKALTIAETTTISEAAKQTSVPSGTIKRWRKEAESTRPEPNEPNEPPKKLKELQRAAMERAVDQAGEYIAERLKGLTNSLYSLAEKAANKVDVAISDPDELPKGKKAEIHNKDGAAWLRSLVGVLSQSVEKAQLLAGKPTGRLENQEQVTKRYEVLHKIEEYAGVYTKLAERGRGVLPGFNESDNPGEPVDTE